SLVGNVNYPAEMKIRIAELRIVLEALQTDNDKQNIQLLPRRLPSRTILNAVDGSCALTHCSGTEGSTSVNCSTTAYVRRLSSHRVVRGRARALRRSGRAAGRLHRFVDALSGHLSHRWPALVARQRITAV